MLSQLPSVSSLAPQGPSRFYIFLDYAFFFFPRYPEWYINEVLLSPFPSTAKLQLKLQYLIRQAYIFFLNWLKPRLRLHLKKRKKRTTQIRNILNVFHFHNKNICKNDKNLSCSSKRFRAIDDPVNPHEWHVMGVSSFSCGGAPDIRTEMRWLCLIIGLTAATSVQKTEEGSLEWIHSCVWRTC